MVNVLVIEDDQVDQLSPITLSRPAYAMTCACRRLYDWLEQLDATVVSLVRPHLRTIQQLDYPLFADALSDFPLTVVISARLVPSRSNFTQLQRLIKECDSQQQPDQIRIASDSEQRPILAVVPTNKVADKSLEEVIAIVSDAVLANIPKLNQSFSAIRFPHDLIHYNQECFGENIEFLLTTKQYKEVKDGLFVANDAEVADNISVNAADGPVVIDSGATVGPFSYFAGPVYVGPNCKVSEHSAIKDFVCLTHTVKVGGEIEATVIEPRSNKQHHGFLGHAYLGSWINFGAGTCNSDLKNSYGKVNMSYGPTGMQFVGCVVGDYSKTAINTSIFTGKVVGVCSNLYGFISDDVPSFVNFATSFGEMTQQTLEAMQVTQKRMFARRSIRQRPCDIQLLADMFKLTSSERPDGLSTALPSLSRFASNRSDSR